MKMIQRSVATLLCVTLVPALQADVLVTNLVPATAVYDDGVIATIAGGVIQPTLANGHSFNIEFTPSADDLSGTVLLLEIGGTSNGTGLYLIDGVLAYISKHNGTDDALPTGLDDTVIDPASAVTNTFGPVTAGVAYSAAASWDQAGHLVLALQADTGGVGALDEITMTGTFGNWSGDESWSVGQNPRLGAGGPGGSVGGLAGEVAGNEYGPPFDVEDDLETPLLKSFSGTIARALYWNAVGEIGLFPSGTAAGLTWANPGSGSFGVATNWSPNQVPSVSDTPMIANGGTAQISDGNDYSVTNILIGAGADAVGTAQISHGSLTLLADESTFLGRSSGASGTIDVTTGGSLFKNAGLLRVGSDQGVGSVNVTGGNVFLNALMLGGDDTSATTNGQGSLNLVSGQVVVTNQIQIGRDLETGTLTITGGSLTNYNLDRDAQDFLTAGGFDGGTGTVVVAGGVLYNETGIRLANGSPAYPASGTVKLNGGEIITSQIFRQGNGTGLVEFDGGTLTALSNNIALIATNDAMTINVKAGGAIINTDGNDVEIGVGLNEDYTSPGGGLTKNGAGQLTIIGLNTYSGPTVVNEGGLQIDAGAYGGGSITLADGTEFGVALPSAFAQTFVSSITLGSGGSNTLDFEFGSTGSPGVAPLTSYGALNANGTVTVNISGENFTTGQFPLIGYGTLSGTGFPAFHLGPLPLGMTAELVNSGASIDLHIISYVKALAWNGAQNNNWDTSSVNWIDLNSSATAAYSQSSGVGDSVTFDESQFPLNNTDINLDITVNPLTMAVNNNSTPYSFSGSGEISGVTGITKDGAASLGLATANDYSGGTTLNAGEIQVGNDSALGTGELTVTGGALASDGTTAHTISNNIVLNGNLTLGSTTNPGILNLAGVTTLDANRVLTLNSDVIISGTFSNTVPNAGLDYIDGPGSLTISSSGVVDIAELFEQGNGNVIVDGGTFINREGYRLYSPNPNSTQMLLVTNGGFFAMDHRIGESAGGGNLVIGANVRTGSDTTATNLIEVADGTVMAITSEGGNGRILFAQANGGAVSMMNIRANGTVICRHFQGQQGTSGRISELNIYGGTVSPIANDANFMLDLSSVFIRTGGVTVDTVTNTITIGQPLLDGGGGGGLTKTGEGTLYLTGTNTYAGTTVVNQGSLGGIGVIAGPMSVGASGNLAPGSAGIGTLTLNNSLSLAGSVTADVSVEGGVTNNDVVTGFSAVTYGGTLVINNVGAAPLEAGMVFDLFNGPAGTGNFTSVAVTPDAGLSGTFDPATGAVTLTSVTTARLDYANLGDGVVQFSWSGPYKLIYQTNTLSQGLGTNWMDYPDTGNPVNVTNNPAIPVSFFGLGPL